MVVLVVVATVVVKVVVVVAVVVEVVAIVVVGAVVAVVMENIWLILCYTVSSLVRPIYVRDNCFSIIAKQSR